MAQWLKLEPIRHQVAIAGRVLNARTNEAMAGALIEIKAAPPAFDQWLAVYALQFGAQWNSLLNRPDRTRTAPDGHFHFLDLPDGQYTLTASMPGSGTRLGTAQAIVAVSRNAQGKLAMAVSDIALPPTTLKGTITGPNAANVVLAQVRINGSGECAYTNGQGQYLLAGLEVGHRIVSVTAQGYQSASQAVTLSTAGGEQTLNFSLISSTP